MKKYRIIILALLFLFGCHGVYGCHVVDDGAAERAAAAEANLEAAIQRRNKRMMEQKQSNQQPTAEPIVREEDSDVFFPPIPPVPPIQ